MNEMNHIPQAVICAYIYLTPHPLPFNHASFPLTESRWAYRIVCLSAHLNVNNF